MKACEGRLLYLKPRDSDSIGLCAPRICISQPGKIFLTNIHKFFGTPSFKRWGLIFLPLSVGKIQPLTSNYIQWMWWHMISRQSSQRQDSFCALSLRAWEGPNPMSWEHSNSLGRKWRLLPTSAPIWQLGEGITLETDAPVLVEPAGDSNSGDNLPATSWETLH